MVTEIHNGNIECLIRHRYNVIQTLHNAKRAQICTDKLLVATKYVRLSAICFVGL